MSSAQPSPPTCSPRLCSEHCGGSALSATVYLGSRRVLPEPREGCVVIPLRFCCPARRGGPLFSYSYKSLFPPIPCFHIHANPPGVHPSQILLTSLPIRAFSLKSRVSSYLPPLWPLFVLFFSLPFFVFNNNPSLVPEQPGWGASMALDTRTTQRILGK